MLSVGDIETKAAIEVHVVGGKVHKLFKAVLVAGTGVGLDTIAPVTAEVDLNMIILSAFE
jgi:hypothetical protein